MMHGVKKERLSFDGLPLVSKSKVNSRKYITSDSLVVSSFSKFPTALRSPGKLPALIAKTAPIGISRKGTARAYRYKLYPGNNVRVVMSSLRRRPWWHPVSSAEDTEDTANQPNFIWEMYRNPLRYASDSYSGVMLNHIQNNNCLVSKKGLYFSLKSYCSESGINLLSVIPRTFYLSSQSSNTENDEFLAYNRDVMSACHSSGNGNSDSLLVAGEDFSSTPTARDSRDDHSQGIVWILKPASKTNRGFGIKVVRGIEEVDAIVNRRSSSRGKRVVKSTNAPTSSVGIVDEKDEKLGRQEALAKDAQKKAVREGWIVQEYMTHPLLVRGRKFDIRCFVLLTHCQRKGLSAYFFDDAYVRTSSKRYTLNDISDRETHLTNDAVQKHSKAYGKFESGNKLDFDQWQKTVDEDYPAAPKGVVLNHIYPEIKRLTALSIAAGAAQMSKSDISRSFELLGYDYMVDSNFNPTLIEINSNPCLEFACPLLTELITSLIENTVRVALDPQFPPAPPGSRTRSTEEAITAIEAAEVKFHKIFPQ